MKIESIKISTFLKLLFLLFFSGMYYIVINNNASLKENDVFFDLGNTVSCSSLPIAVPTDDEKRHVYTKAFDDRLYYKKGVFLTFDDGPSRNTLKVLDILNENSIKATFFVVGDSAEKYPDIINKAKESGMSILTHSYTHKYEIYKSLNLYMEDLYKCSEVISNLTNETPMPFVRFPGGSSNSIGEKNILSKIKETLKNKSIMYVDWNVSSADAAESVVPKNLILNNVINQCKNKNMAVVLMHDAPTKVTTVEALPEIIKSLKESGFVFRTFDDISKAEERDLIKRKIINR